MFGCFAAAGERYFAGLFSVRESTVGERKGLQGRCLRGDDGVGVGDLAASDHEPPVADLDPEPVVTDVELDDSLEAVGELGIESGLEREDEPIDAQGRFAPSAGSSAPQCLIAVSTGSSARPRSVSSYAEVLLGANRRRRTISAASSSRSRLAAITQPVLVATGGRPDPHLEGLGPGFFDEAADAITAALPNAQRRTIDGETQVADPQSFAAVLEQFFTSSADSGTSWGSITRPPTPRPPG
ncbi:hypothetical protein OHA10_21720 [Kribbella sp. NBC_00662]